MPYVITNETAFRGYRHLVTIGIAEYRGRPLSVPMLVGYIGAQCGVPMSLAAGAIPESCALALATWLFRYMRRRDTIHASGGYGDPLADKVAGDILVARSRKRDGGAPQFPEWD